MRIVSLIPSGTEIVGLLGAESLLVGRSHRCDFPVGVDSVPALTGRGFDVHRVYGVDRAKLADLSPNLILAGREEEIEGVVDGAVILRLNPQTVEDILDDIYRVGEAICCQDQAMHAVVGLRQRMDRAEEHINPYDDGPICGFLEWTDPICVAGLWTVQLIGRAGARHPLNEVFARPGSGAAVGPQQAQRVAGPPIAVSSELFWASEPEYLVVALRGMGLDEGVRATNRLFRDTDWFRFLPAVVNDCVVVVDGEQMFHRPGPRVVDGLEFLVGWLNGCGHLIPDDFPWVRWSAGGGA